VQQSTLPVESLTPTVCALIFLLPLAGFGFRRLAVPKLYSQDVRIQLILP
jgi:hypothetical protein